MTKINTTLRAKKPAEAVDEKLVLPTFFPQLQMVFCHAETGEGEPGEHADGVDADEDVQLGVGGHHQRLSGDREQDDAV